ncbi:MAG: hypothetical protein WD187_00975 [Candidatus Woykebacteria bacterium]
MTRTAFRLYRLPRDADELGERFAKYLEAPEMESVIVYFLNAVPKAPSLQGVAMVVQVSEKSGFKILTFYCLDDTEKWENGEPSTTYLSTAYGNISKTFELVPGVEVTVLFYKTRGREIVQVAEDLEEELEKRNPLRDQLFGDASPFHLAAASVDR